MIKITDIRIGSIVNIREAFSNEHVKTSTVKHICVNIKNGKPGIDYNDGVYDRWAYLSEITRVVTH